MYAGMLLEAHVAMADPPVILDLYQTVKHNKSSVRSTELLLGPGHTLTTMTKTGFGL